MAQLAIDCGNNFIQIVGVLDSEKGKVVLEFDGAHMTFKESNKSAKEAEKDDEWEPTEKNPFE